MNSGQFGTGFRAWTVQKSFAPRGAGETYKQAMAFSLRSCTPASLGKFRSPPNLSQAERSVAAVHDKTTF